MTRTMNFEEYTQTTSWRYSWDKFDTLENAVAALELTIQAKILNDLKSELIRTKGARIDSKNKRIEIDVHDRALGLYRTFTMDFEINVSFYALAKDMIKVHEEFTNKMKGHNANANDLMSQMFDQLYGKEKANEEEIAYVTTCQNDRLEAILELERKWGNIEIYSFKLNDMIPQTVYEPERWY